MVYYWKDLPNIVADEHVKWFKRSFRLGGFFDRRLEKWPKRRSKRYSHPVLLKTTKLRNAIRVKYVRNRAHSMDVQIVNEMPYAQLHNEGFEGSVQVRAHKRRLKKGKKKIVDVRSHKRRVVMPKRPFMQPSYALSFKVKKMIDNAVKAELNKIIKK